MALGSRDGTPVMVILAVVGIVGAMVAAVVLVYATQALGSTSQRAANAATAGAPTLTIESAYVRTQGGVPVEVQWIIAAGASGDASIDQLTLRMDTGAAQWNVSGADEVAPVRDVDGSVSSGAINAGDIIVWSVPLEGRPLPDGRPGTVTLAAGGQEAVFLVSMPLLRSGDHLVPLKVA